MSTNDPPPRTTNELFSNNTIRILKYILLLMAYIVGLYVVITILRSDLADSVSNLFFGVLGTLGAIVSALITGLVQRQTSVSTTQNNLPIDEPTNTRIQP